jgi:hypothetical protein
MSLHAPISDLPLFNLAQAREERDEALDRVGDSSLADELDRLLHRHVGREVTGEDVRALHGSEVHHPNAWGAAINALVRRGRLLKTGEYRPMQRPSSHARATPVYLVHPNPEG